MCGRGGGRETYTGGGGRRERRQDNASRAFGLAHGVALKTESGMDGWIELAFFFCAGDYALALLDAV